MVQQGKLTMDHTPMHRHTRTHAGVQMDRVLLLNNAYYVDSIKDTWAERAGHCSGTLGSSVRAARSIPCANLELSQNVQCVGI